VAEARRRSNGAPADPVRARPYARTRSKDVPIGARLPRAFDHSVRRYERTCWRGAVPTLLPPWLDLEPESVVHHEAVDPLPEKGGQFWPSMEGRLQPSSSDSNKPRTFKEGLLLVTKTLARSYRSEMSWKNWALP
jgi:hypothetical protein